MASLAELLSPLLQALPQALPPSLLAAAFTVAALALVVVARLVHNSLPGSAPPVFEGIPFIGGVLKFVKVQCARGGSAPTTF